MQVVFIQSIKGVAKKGEVKNVKDGYFQNYLLPHKMAVVATAAKLKEAESMRKNEVLQKDKVAEQAHEIKAKLKNLKLMFKGKANGDKLYGSIGEKEIIDLIEAETKVKLDRQHVKLSEHIKVLGTYEIPILLTEGVETKVTLTVKGEK